MRQILLLAVVERRFSPTITGETFCAPRLNELQNSPKQRHVLPDISRESGEGPITFDHMTSYGPSR